MKVLLVNGSPHQKGSTYHALEIVAKALQAEGIDTELFQVGPKPVQDCIGCWQCMKKGACVFTQDNVNAFVEASRKADGFVFGTPVYFAHPAGQVQSFLNRVFISGGDAFAYKPGAAVAVARRAGTTASLDVLNKYFGISRMLTVGSSYWNLIHGAVAADLEQDPEGVQTLREMGKNMAWLLHCLEAAKKAGIAFPKPENKVMTNFVR
ncbi:MAG: flavodoxin family protein [Acidaminococcus sp.]|jgi:multimeric flavodoxin WrbA|nr:flavodoxin family protein [Acidaminococcus sp.]MCI2100622.1 flavodoxin family protein [Acidaminococcus sp.]MCI2114943.1 flavodoxin family protein [Acidaminococcus sp.]MCI2116969.1 flavodoxin family protein [Acidaminococcus sp.]